MRGVLQKWRAAATINSCIARKPRSAAVMSVAVIVTRAVCCVAIGRLRDTIEGQRRAEARLRLFRGRAGSALGGQVAF